MVPDFFNNSHFWDFVFEKQYQYSLTLHEK
jgi:hypothetical protein